MAGDTIGCTARRKSKNKAPEKSNKSDNDDLKAPVIPPKATRGGLRVYKIVMLGSGFVGKSGNFFFSFPFIYIGYIRLYCFGICCYVDTVTPAGLYVCYMFCGICVRRMVMVAVVVAAHTFR